MPLTESFHNYINGLAEEAVTRQAIPRGLTEDVAQWLYETAGGMDTPWMSSVSDQEFYMEKARRILTEATTPAEAWADARERIRRREFYNPDTHRLVLRDAATLDLTSINVRAVVKGLRDVMGGPSALLLADQLEAYQEPQRMDEPGWGSIVEAGVKEHDQRMLWVAVWGRPGGGKWWTPNAEGEYDRRWADLIDPKPVTEGTHHA